MEMLCLSSLGCAPTTLVYRKISIEHDRTTIAFMEATVLVTQIKISSNNNDNDAYDKR